MQYRSGSNLQLWQLYCENDAHCADALICRYLPALHSLAELYAPPRETRRPVRHTLRVHAQGLALYDSTSGDRSHPNAALFVLGPALSKLSPLRNRPRSLKLRVRNV